MKKIFYVAVALVCSFAGELRADDLPTFRLTSGTGQCWNFRAEGLTLKPAGDLLLVTQADGTSVSLDLNTLASATFSTDDFTGIADVVRADGACSVYSIGGMALDNFSSESEARKVLAPGFYVMKTESATRKLIVQ